MNNKYKMVNMSVISFTWVGMILGISILEGPLIFQAQDITLALGLGVDKFVFGAFTKIEILYSLILVSILLMTGLRIRIWAFSWFR